MAEAFQEEGVECVDIQCDDYIDTYGLKEVGDTYEDIAHEFLENFIAE